MIYVLNGGDGLNFKVVQYTTTPTGAAAENTIGVVTDTAITSWVMQAEQPAGVEGMVWIKVAAASDVAFFADKKQLVKLYPISVRQYVDGSWVNKEARIYQNSEWVEISNGILMLYSYGNQCSSVTGGYAGSNSSGGTYSFGTSSITLNAVSNSTYSASATAQTANAIDITNYDEIVFTLSTSQTGNKRMTFHWGVKNVSGTIVARGTIAETSTKSQRIVDISKLSGRHYVYAKADGYYEQSYGQMVIYEIFLR